MFAPGPLPSPDQAVAHARAVADQAIDYADEVVTWGRDRLAVDRRCAAWSRQSAEEQRAAAAEARNRGN